MRAPWQLTQRGTCWGVRGTGADSACYLDGKTPGFSVQSQGQWWAWGQLSSMTIQGCRCIHLLSPPCSLPWSGQENWQGRNQPLQAPHLLNIIGKAIIPRKEIPYWALLPAFIPPEGAWSWATSLLSQDASTVAGYPRRTESFPPFLGYPRSNHRETDWLSWGV